MILQDIVLNKRKQLKIEMHNLEINDWYKKLINTKLHQTYDFYNLLNTPNEIVIIAEIKRASPSKGVIKENFDPMDIAKEYYEAGVNAVSILTEKNFFSG